MNLWAILGIVVAGALSVGTAATIINNRAYDRGVLDTKAAMQKVLDKKAADGRADRDAIKKLPDKDIDCELLKMRGEPCAP